MGSPEGGSPSPTLRRTRRIGLTRPHRVRCPYLKEVTQSCCCALIAFRDIDRLAHEILGAPRVPQPMPMVCYRHGDTFFLHFDLPGIDTDTLEVTEENNTLTVRAQRRAAVPED